MTDLGLGVEASGPGGAASSPMFAPFDSGHWCGNRSTGGACWREGDGPGPLTPAMRFLAIGCRASDVGRTLPPTAEDHAT